MTEQQEKIQNILDDFILKNDGELERVSTENPLLLKSVLDVVDVLSKKFGTGKTTEVSKPEPVEEKSEEVIIKADTLPFKEGDYFYHKDDKRSVYMIFKILSNKYDSSILEKVIIQLPDGKTVTQYPIEDVIKYFNEGQWLLTREPSQKVETKVETVSEIKKEQEEQLSAEDIKAAIKNLKPLAEFDEDVQKEIDRLKQQLKTLKGKKS